MNDYRNSCKILGVCVGLLLSINGFAASKKEAVKDPWSGSVGVGFSQTTGNTNVTNLNTRITGGYENKPWESNAEFTTLFNKADGEATAESYAAGIETHYYFYPRWYAFLRNTVTHDLFATYDWTSSHIVGVGYQIIDRKDLQWRAQSGPGYRYQREATTKKSSHQAIFFVSTNVLWKFSDNASLGEILSSEIGSPNIYTTSETRLKAKLIGHLSADISFLVKHNSYIPPISENRNHWDTLTQVALVYDF